MYQWRRCESIKLTTNSAAKIIRRKPNGALHQVMGSATERRLRSQRGSAFSVPDGNCQVYPDAFLQVYLVTGEYKIRLRAAI